MEKVSFYTVYDFFNNDLADFYAACLWNLIFIVTNSNYFLSTCNRAYLLSTTGFKNPNMMIYLIFYRGVLSSF